MFRGDACLHVDSLHSRNGRPAAEQRTRSPAPAVMESRDPNAGLFGAIIVTSKEYANDDATPKDVDRWGTDPNGGPNPALALDSGSLAPRCSSSSIAQVLRNTAMLALPKELILTSAKLAPY